VTDVPCWDVTEDWARYVRVQCSVSLAMQARILIARTTCTLCRSLASRPICLRTISADACTNLLTHSDVAVPDAAATTVIHRVRAGGIGPR
jgi:hypothetical protein